MNIIIDTNILYDDLLVKGPSFKILKDYLSKTDCHFIIPQIVIDETVGIYRRSLAEKINSLNLAIEKVENFQLIEEKIEPYKLDIENETLKYKEHLISELKLNPENIIPYNDSHLKEIVHRSINRIKPGKADGKQFRDICLWLSIKDYIKTVDQEITAFISKNHKDFGNGNKNELDPQILDELKSENLDEYIKYYSKLDDFLKDHAKAIDFITLEWLQNSFNHTTIELYLNSQLVLDPDVVIDRLKDRLESNQEFDQYDNVTDYSNYSIEDYLVFPLDTGEILVRLTIGIELQFEYCFIEHIEKYEMQERTITSYDSEGYPYPELDFSPVHDIKRELRTSGYEQKLLLNCVLTIESKSIVKFDYTNYEYE